MPDSLALPQVSIVTPSFNQAQFIEETIRSVLAQGYPNLEYIIIDGGSTDGTVEIIKKYEPWLWYWVSEPDAGQADAINKGLRMAQGQIVAYLNSDDIFLPDSIRAIVECFHNDPALGLVYGDCQTIDAAGDDLGPLPSRAFNLRRLIERAEFIPQPATFWRRDVMTQIGMFDPALRYTMDYDFFIRVARAFPVAHLPRPVACFRVHGVSKTTAQTEKMWREALKVSERHGLKFWMPWYWLRRIKHWSVNALPESIQLSIRQRLKRAYDPYVYSRTQGKQ